MTWEVFYFVCFLVGFLLSLLTFVGGASHLHLPHMHGHGHGHAGVKGGPGSWFNFGTITAFLAWFGGTGYLLTRYSNIWALLGLGIATLSGVGGAALVFWFLFKFLLAHERSLDPADYNMIGVLGRVSSTVREGGTGEMIFPRDGARSCAAIRSDNNHPIPKNIEVVVVRYEKGIAYVRPWDELSDGDPAPWSMDADPNVSGPATGNRRDQSESVN